MSSDEKTPGAEHASVSPLSSISSLWLIPIVTLFVGLWMIYDSWSEQGPLITISFSSAEGLEEGKTPIKTRNIHVGDVISISLEEGLDGVLVTARMREEARGVLNEDARFWVVQPQIGLSGITGLGTLLAGQHIEFSPGSGGKILKHFDGLNKPPLTPPGTPGLHLTLNSKDNFSYGEGDPILYRGFKVGKIEDIYFNSSERMMYYNTFIEAPYHRLVTTNTRFWDVSGIRAELSATGIVVQSAGLQALILGGIAFGLPEGEAPAERVDDRAYYLIYPSRTSSEEQHYDQALTYVLLVESNAGGLSLRAPVMLRGMQVGEVVRTGYIPSGANLLDANLQIPVHIALHPARLGLPDTVEGRAQVEESVRDWLAQGMTASLKSGAVIFGQKLVELTLPKVPIAGELAQFDGLPVIPVTPDGGLDQVIAQVNDLLAGLNRVQVDKIGEGLERTLEEAAATMAGLRAVASSGDALLLEARQRELVNSLDSTLEEFGALAKNYGAGSTTDRELKQLLEVMVDVLSDLQTVLTELKIKPNSLIFTGRGAEEKEPQRKAQ